MKYEGKNDQHQMMYLFVLFERKPSMYPEFATLTSRSKKNCLSSNLGRSLDSTDFLGGHDGSTWNFILRVSLSPRASLFLRDKCGTS